MSEYKIIATAEMEVEITKDLTEEQYEFLNNIFNELMDKDVSGFAPYFEIEKIN